VGGEGMNLSDKRQLILNLENCTVKKTLLNELCNEQLLLLEGQNSIMDARHFDGGQEAIFHE